MEIGNETSASHALAILAVVMSNSTGAAVNRNPSYENIVIVSETRYVHSPRHIVSTQCTANHIGGQCGIFYQATPN